MKNKKEIIEIIMCMLKCSFAATVLNPGTFLAFIMAPLLFLYFVVAYIVVGTPLYYLLRKKTWGIHIIAAWLIINVILTSVLTYILFIIETGPKGIICPATFIITGILSIISVIYLCRKTNEEMDIY